MLLPDNCITIPYRLGPIIVQEVHESVHIGQENMEKLLGHYYYIHHLAALGKGVVQQCVICSKKQS